MHSNKFLLSFHYAPPYDLSYTTYLQTERHPEWLTTILAGLKWNFIPCKLHWSELHSMHIFKVQMENCSDLSSAL